MTLSNYEQQLLNDLNNELNKLSDEELIIGSSVKTSEFFERYGIDCHRPKDHPPIINRQNK